MSRDAYRWLTRFFEIFGSRDPKLEDWTLRTTGAGIELDLVLDGATVGLLIQGPEAPRSFDATASLRISILPPGLSTHSIESEIWINGLMGLLRRADKGDLVVSRSYPAAQTEASSNQEP